MIVRWAKKEVHTVKATVEKETLSLARSTMQKSCICSSCARYRRVTRSLLTSSEFEAGQELSLDSVQQKPKKCIGTTLFTNYALLVQSDHHKEWLSSHMHHECLGCFFLGCRCHQELLPRFAPWTTIGLQTHLPAVPRH